MKIRREAEEVLNWEYPKNLTWIAEPFRKQAKRVLLLEKAYRYQLAADRLTSFGLCEVILERPGSHIVEKGQECRDKAADLYRQAEEV